jgi:DNA-binding MarR family transcriptional regulator
MTKQDKIERLIETFNETRRSMGKGFDFKDGATKTQCNALIEIKHGAQRVSDLAKRLNTTPSATTQLINQLVDDGYVSRKDSVTDRRETQLEVTDKGRELLKKVHHHMRQRATDIATVLSDDELEQFIDISYKVANYINNKQEN